MRAEQFRQAILEEMKLPNFKGRHLFIARLRMIIFVLCWFLFIVFYRGIWVSAPLVPLVFNIGFLMTAFCYWYIVQEKYVLTMTALEALADVVSQTTLIYLLGPDSFIVFLFYGMYVIASGAFFGYIVALMAASLALFSYCVLVFLVGMEWIPVFVYPPQESLEFATPDFGFFFNLLFLPIALGIIVYGARISNYFSKIKERALETRNIQLLALNHIGSTIRRAMNLRTVIDQVLKGVIQGLGFDVCFLALLSKTDSRIHFYAPEGNQFVAMMEEILGRKLSDSYFPADATEHSAYQSITKNRVIIRKEFQQLTFGMVPSISEDKAIELQTAIGFKKFVITPLVAERRVVGALIGASCKEYVEESVVDTLDNFANQAALAIESAQLIEELQTKNIQLEEANKIKSDFLAIMTHELRTPLTAIIGYSELLLDRDMGELNKEQNDSLKEVLKNAENLLQLINSILDLAKVEAGKMELSTEEFFPSEIIVEVQQTLLPLLAKKNHHFKICVDSNLPQLKADPRKLRQILLNLIGNAIKFTQEKGAIEVGCTYFPHPDQLAEEFGFKPLKYAGQGVFRFTVRDNGIGIKKEHLTHLFDIFHQVDSTFTRRYQGTGLGLSLSKQLIELHGGLIQVDSEFGKGSEFKFLLPESPL